MSNESEHEGTIAQRLQSLGNLKKQKKRTSSVPLKQFTLLDNNDERRLKLVGKNAMKNPTHVCNHCDTCHFFSWKGNSYDSNKAKNHLRECNEDGQNSILHQENETKIKKERAHLNLVENLNTCSTYAGAKDLKKEDCIERIAPIVQQMKVNHFSLPTYQDKALCSQAHYFLYSRGSPPFSQFQKPEFKTMLTNMIPTGLRWPIVTKAPILNSR